MRDEDDRSYRIAGSPADISVRKRAGARLVHDALHDALTTLPKRALFVDRLVLSLGRFALRKMGVQLHVDDFGTGYSSLSYLQRFAYDSLKIDRSFVSGIDAQSGDSAIVGAIIALGHLLGIRVIAEGVETHQQLEALRDMQCPQAQGFWFSKPLDQSGIGALLNERIGNGH